MEIKVLFLVSSSIADKSCLLYTSHLYDDRGLDVLGSSQELLLPLYRQFHSWILEYDLEQIDRLFASED